MKDLPVSKKLKKYACSRESNIIRRATLLLYVDEIERLEERLIKSEIELAWKNAVDTEEHIKDLQVRLDATNNMLKAWQEVFKCDGPWEAEFKHKTEIAIISVKLERAQRLLVMMMASVIRDDMMKSLDIKKTVF